MSISKINNFFNPRTIAVVGANDRQNSPGFSIYKNIKNGFKGKVFPVNINSATVQGDKSYKSLSDIPELIDLAIIATPANTVLGLLEACGKKGIKNAVIISSGFLEAGDPGKILFENIKETGIKHDIKILGPNCLGFINPTISLNASFAPLTPKQGGIAFISQSGALCNTFLDWSVNDQIGYRYFVSIGSMADIGFEDLIEYLNSQPEVTSILLYMESVNDGKRFMNAVRNFSAKKPIVVLKAGVAKQGIRAVASHTGTIAGNDKIFSAVFKEIGAIRVKTISELYNYGKLFNRFKLKSGRKLAIISNAGGPAVIATDYLISKGGDLAELSPQTVSALNLVMPSAWSKGNPIDVLGDGQSVHYQKAIEECLKDPAVDAIVAILTPQAVTDTVGIARAIANIAKDCEKPIIASFMGNDTVKEGVDILIGGNVPVFRTPEQAIRCLAGLSTWEEYTKSLNGKDKISEEIAKNDKNVCESVIGEYRKKNQKTITGKGAKKIIDSYKVPVNPAFTANNEDEAVNISAKIGYPVAMKLEIEGLLHKTETGGVRLNLSNSKEIKRNFKELKEILKSNGKAGDIVIEKMIFKKYELFIGVKKDPLFGAVIAFGAGGIAVEVFNDVAIGLAPLTTASTKRLMQKTKIYALLQGYRNQKGANIPAIANALIGISSLVTDFPEIKEIDINPLFADEDGVVAVDAKIVLED